MNSETRILKNVIVVCLTMLLLYTAFNGIRNLQSTINCTGKELTIWKYKSEYKLIYGGTKRSTGINSIRRWLRNREFDSIICWVDSLVIVSTNLINSKDWLKMDNGRFVHWIYGLYCLQFLSRILHTYTCRSDSWMCCRYTLEC